MLGIYISIYFCLRSDSKAVAKGLESIFDPPPPDFFEAGRKSPWHMKWHEITWNDMKWHEVTWNDMNLNDMKWHEMTWNDMKWDEMKLTYMNYMMWPITKVALNDSQRHRRGTYLFFKFYIVLNFLYLHIHILYLWFISSLVPPVSA
jgi:hypothetical protein